jgi:hypothetical protein
MKLEIKVETKNHEKFTCKAKFNGEKANFDAKNFVDAVDVAMSRFFVTWEKQGIRT